MNIKSAFFAAIVALGTITGANAASAAPLAAPAAATAETQVVDAGYGYKRYGYRHGYKRYGYKHGYGKRVHFKKHCFKKKYRVWSHYKHGWVYKYKTVCHRKYY